MLTRAFLQLAALPLLLCSCITEKCDPGDKNVYNSAIIDFTLRDASGRNLLDFNGRYASDTVKVYDQRQRPVFRGPVRLDGNVGFAPLQLEIDQLPYATALTRRYYLYLSRADADTIDLAFQLRKNDCGFTEFQRYEVLYNGASVSTGEGLYLPSLTFRKK